MIRQHYGLVLLLASFALTSCRSAKDTGAPATDESAKATAAGSRELPEGWQLDAISEAVSIPDGEPTQFSAREAHVLAWKVRQDHRPFTVEECLVLKRFADPAGEQRWVLAAVYRPPPKEEWHLSVRQYLMPATGGMPGYCRWVFHRKVYPKCPNNEALYAFVDESEWPLVPEKGWRLLRSRVCRDTWRNVIGEEPTRFFPPSDDWWAERDAAADRAGITALRGTLRAQPAPLLNFSVRRC